MDSYPLAALTGTLFIFGGIILLVVSAYATVVFSIFIITEVLAASLIVTLGIYLVNTSIKKMKEDYDIPESIESGRMSPFYFELEPTSLKRELPPVPRNIGREYDPIVMDKV